MKKKKLRNRIAELEGSVDFLRHFRDEQNGLVKEQTILLSSYEHDFQVQKDEISKQGQYIDSLEEQLGRSMAEIELLEKENKDLKEQIEDFEKSYKADLTEIERLSKLLSLRDKDVAFLEKNIERLQAIQEKDLAQIKYLKKKIASTLRIDIDY